MTFSFSIFFATVGIYAALTVAGMGIGKVLEFVNGFFTSSDNGLDDEAGLTLIGVAIVIGLPILGFMLGGWLGLIAALLVMLIAVLILNS